MDSISDLDKLDTDAKRRQFIENLICFAACVEGLFFFGSFAYVYFLRNKGLLPGLATATNWVFRDESMHIEAAMEAIRTIKHEYPHLFDELLEQKTRNMMAEAIDTEMEFCDDVLSQGITGLSPVLMRQYLEYVSDLRMQSLGFAKVYNVKNPFPFMLLQDVQSLTNFFEKRVTEYKKGFEASSNSVAFDESF